MSKLKLTKIKKSYKLGSERFLAVKGVSLNFRENEFVSILGQSGCGKTTLLNVIGGLDRYDSGDLIINGMSTKKFKNANWDAYRNNSIGFVFQNYNLISHQSVLQNVEIAMTLSGVSKRERKRRAIEALNAVGLGNQLKKKPAQMSGGQMQRVAIARALVNNPDIILADEPTGALDSQTSVQVMEILKEVAKTRLVIMVTHNAELAEKYSTRIIRMLDGEVTSDSNPLEDEPISENVKPKKLRKTSMSMLTATSLSFKNLLTKKGRTIITSFAGSIGIIGVALVLALSSGLSSYMTTMQSEALAGFPITIKAGAQMRMGPPTSSEIDELSGRTKVKFPTDDVLYNYDSSAMTTQHENIFTDDYLAYIEKITDELPKAVNAVSYTQGIEMNVIAKNNDEYVLYSSKANASDAQQMAALMGANTNFWEEMPDNEDFILSLYELIGEGSRMPTNKNEVLLLVDEYNRIDKTFFEKLGIDNDENYKLTDFIGKQILSVVPNNSYYTETNGIFMPKQATEYKALYESDDSIKLTITGVLRIKDGAGTEYFNSGIIYTTDLTEYVVENAKNSDIAKAQKDNDTNVLMGVPFQNNNMKKTILNALGVTDTPTGINIYPKDFSGKDAVKDYLDAYNEPKSEDDQVVYTDLAEMVTTMTQTLLDTVSYVLIGFAAISLVVSTIMIAIITYVSVIERTKEIGILRAVGARKKDISRVFNAETLIIGLTAGLFGVGLSYLLTIPINALVYGLVKIDNIAALNVVHAAALILGSMVLTLIAGFVPSRMAAKKDPVEALRTE